MIPIHMVRQRLKDPTGKRRPNPAAIAAVAAVAGAGGLVSGLVKQGLHDGGVAGALLVVIVASVGGFLLARGIGKQGRI